MKFLNSKKLSELLLASTLFFILSDIDYDVQDDTPISVSEIQLIVNDTNDIDNDYDDYDFEFSDNKIWNINVNTLHDCFMQLIITNYDLFAEKPSKYIICDSSQPISEHFLYYTIWSRGSFV